MAKTASKFEGRVRFNWGFWDAINAHKNGSMTKARNFGFPSWGKFQVECPRGVWMNHPDRAYAEGWIHGYRTGCDPEVRNTIQTSEGAWKEYQTEKKHPIDRYRRVTTWARKRRDAKAMAEATFQAIERRAFTKYVNVFSEQYDCPGTPVAFL
jgi:hypothetical protein